MTRVRPRTNALAQRLSSLAAADLPRSHTAPKRQIRLAAVSYRLLRPRFGGPDVDEAYRCWSTTWRATFAALARQRTLASDDFTRQDEVGAVFHEQECVALSFCRWIDLSSAIARGDSYFSVWPQDAIDAACSRGSRILLSSYFTVSAPWRNAEGESLKQLLAALILERFISSDADAMVGTMRKDRGMGKLTKSFGSNLLHDGLTLHGAAVDLIAFYRDTCSPSGSDFARQRVALALRTNKGAL